MSFFVILLLGVVQGLCEFLPISSSGHLVLLSSLFGVEESLLVSILLHIATLLAVVIVFWKDILFLVKHPFSAQSVCLIVATLCTCGVALVLMPLLKNSFEGAVLPFAFLFSAILLFLTAFLSKKRGGEMSIKKAILIGLAQGVALFPGISRSGTTICAGQLAGVEKKESARFSFLLSIPTILASLFLELIDISSQEVCSVDWLALGVASILAFVIGLASIKFMLKLTEKASFKWFAVYLVGMSIVSAIIFW